MNHLNLVIPRVNKARRAAAFVLILMIAGCATIDKVRDPEPQFNLAQHATWLQGGVASVRGVVKLGDAAPQTCTGHSVYLMPESPYFDYKLKRIGRGEAISDVGLEDDRYDHLVHSVPCGPNGEFAFDNLPEANWILMSTIGLAKNAVGPVLASHIKTQAGLTTNVNLDQATQLTK